MIPITAKDVKRFWRMVKKGSDGECWEWTGAHNSRGTPLFSYKSDSISAGKYCYWLCMGANRIEDGVLHRTCHNVGCINPAHMRLGDKMKRWPKLSAQDRFWLNVDVKDKDECWEWLAGKCPTGYGHLSHDRYAHRVAYEYRYGRIPRGLCVLHQCDNPSCVNPFHLIVGTQIENVKDRDDRGRTSRMFGEEQIRQIRTRRAKGESAKSLAREFGVTDGFIGHIINGKSYRWVT